MDPEVIDYPPNGTLAQLSMTCGGDEDGFRGRLISLERVEDEEGQVATRATYRVIPPQQPYVKKALFFFDVTDSTPEEKQNLTVQQLQLGHAQVFSNGPEAEVFLEDNPATVAVYRQQ